MWTLAKRGNDYLQQKESLKFSVDIKSDDNSTNETEIHKSNLSEDRNDLRETEENLMYSNNDNCKVEQEKKEETILGKRTNPLVSLNQTPTKKTKT